MPHGLLRFPSVACFSCTCLLAVSITYGDTVLLEDRFQRNEPQETKDAIGNEWGTNSRSRAAGNKQTDLVDGALHIYRHKVADHGVSVTHEVAFQDATIEMRFKIGAKDDLGINIADMKEKSVHAGHICMAKITAKRVEIHDLKTGRMNLKLREARQAKTLTSEQEKLIATKSKKVATEVKADQWHELAIQIKGDQMTVSIDGKLTGQFTSPGIGHPTKSRLRLAVNREAWVDDVKVIRND